MAKSKLKCCRRYCRKPKACSSCPLFDGLAKSDRKRAVRHARKRAKAA